jgi:predicted AAA+ superfamily ATPase
VYRRNIKSKVLAALNDFPVILINGARQTGKTTLVRELMESKIVNRYETLDDVALLAAVRQDPVGFLNRISEPIIIDEVQRAPEIFLPIKQAVDSKDKPGMFILTGSANVLTLPKLADSLAGRMAIITLWPLSQGELSDQDEDFITHAFGDSFAIPDPVPLSRDNLLQRIIVGGYPRSLAASSSANRTLWFQSYITQLLERDIRDLSQIKSVMEFPMLLRVLAARSSTLLNLAELSRSTGLQQDTLKRYHSLLQSLFLAIPQPAWTANIGRRLMKTPKTTLNDTGLLSHLVGTSERRLSQDNLLLGQIMETFVVNELRKQLSWSQTDAELFHYRDSNGNETDIVLENRSGEIIGIEVKAAATPRSDDFRGLERLSAATKGRFKRGVLLYSGDKFLSFGNHYAVPVQSLWNPIHG